MVWKYGENTRKDKKNYERDEEVPGLIEHLFVEVVWMERQNKGKVLIFWTFWLKEILEN